MTANGNEASYLAQLESSISSLHRMAADAKQELELAAQEAQWARVTRTPTRLTTTDGSDDGRQDA